MNVASRVSVIIPTRDRFDYLAQALASVARQDAAADVLVVDDGPSGETADRLERNPREGLTVLRSGGAGRSAARNLGARAARTDFVAFLDDDDVFLPEHLSALLSTADSHPGAAVAGRAYLWDPQSGRRRAVNRPLTASQSYRRALTGTVLALQSLLVPRTAFLRVGGFDEGLEGSEDWALLLELTRVTEVVSVPVGGVLIREHSGRSMRDVDWDLHWRSVATDRLLQVPGLRLTPEEARTLRAGSDRYRAARLHEVGRDAEARSLLNAVRQAGVPELTWRRLMLQTIVGRRRVLAVRRGLRR